MKYRIGLDIGIGSIGWAVISGAEDGHPARIEDFGTRIFKSGEKEKNSESLCKERRMNRGVRRNERRRSHRKLLLKNHLINIGFINDLFNDEFEECRDNDVYSLKVRALDEKLSPAELYKCLVHTCNHRGYKDFYEPTEDDKESGKNSEAAKQFETDYLSSGKRTVSEYLLESHYDNGFVRYRNRENGETPYLLIRRTLLYEEIKSILSKQKEYYSCLSDKNTEQIITIIFNQRDFEDGPGNPEDPNRRYHGFIETLGKCQFYKTEDRGFRSTVISDVFAVVNTLSQYRFINTSTGEYCLDRDVAKQLIDHLLSNAELKSSKVKSILKNNGYTLHTDLDSKAIEKAIKYLSVAKKCIDSSGLNWSDIISEEQFDIDNPSTLHRIGELLSKFQTPKRRVAEMKKADISPELIKAFCDKKLSGTSAVSYRYMCDAISAFLDGDIYGNFQGKFLDNQENDQPTERYEKLDVNCIDDPEIWDNRVVFKAINETRKIVNAIIENYGSPEEIVIEVASELGKSPEMRKKEHNEQLKNEKRNDEIKEIIAKLLSIDTKDIKHSMIERYRLYNEQEGKCLYSGKDLGELREVVENRNKVYEIDHIVPYSLILDNTLHNKALVYAGENQKKGQRLPLMYMDKEQAQNYLAFVNGMYSRKENSISKKKLAYCKLESLYGEEASSILDAWKSRNINDTRYITKYIAGLFEKKLVFSGDRKQHVHTVKGAVTSKFRREWFKDSKWGDKEKDRSNYLNHALDAVIAANLTKPYIEIGSDSLRLIAIFKSHKSKITPEYNEYLEKCISKMKTYYGFDEEYTRRLLTKTGRVPSYVPRLAEEVKVRFSENDEKKFNTDIHKLYGNEDGFIIPPCQPITSQKPENKFSGCIADANPIKVIDIGNETHKIKRKDIISLTEKDISKIYTDDSSLIGTLSAILSGKKSGYTVGDYLKENSLSHFTDKNGKVIRKISIDEGVVSNYYRKEIDDGNYSYLGAPKYYCVEVYRNADGDLKTCGVRFVDMVKKNKKLFRKEESLPADYNEHVMYLFKNDFIEIKDRKGNLKIRGYYKSVKVINKSMFYFSEPNSRDYVIKSIVSGDTVIKYNISLLGKIGGAVKCSVPYQCIKVNESR